MLIAYFYLAEGKIVKLGKGGTGVSTYQDPCLIFSSSLSVTFLLLYLRPGVNNCSEGSSSSSWRMLFLT